MIRICILKLISMISIDFRTSSLLYLMQAFFLETFDGLHLGVDYDILNGLINGLNRKGLMLWLWRVNEMRIGAIIIKKQEVKV